ncbi:hypothetical protein HDU99_000446 [Rhizoclosmatium hyalinum]|nr:hypothetical protein HDU99_000446 [Rhizoclosmatium hyalinum]
MSSTSSEMRLLDDTSVGHYSVHPYEAAPVESDQSSEPSMRSDHHEGYLIVTHEDFLPPIQKEFLPPPIEFDHQLGLGKRLKFSEPPRRCTSCCCCPKSKKGKIVYKSRYPDTKVYDIVLTNLFGSSSAFSFSFKNGSDLNTLVFKMNLTLNCGTYNPNMYGITVDQIDLVAQMMVNTSYVFSNYLTKPLTSFGALTQLVGPPPVNPFPDTYFGRNDSVIGTAQSLSPIFFPSKQWVNYSLNFELSYTPDPYLGILRDPTILEIADACGITSRYKPPGRGMRIHYTAVSTIAAFKWLNFAPSLQNDVNIICPFWPDQIEKVVSYVENDGLPVLEALKIVFENAKPPPTNTTSSS